MEMEQMDLFPSQSPQVLEFTLHEPPPPPVSQGTNTSEIFPSASEVTAPTPRTKNLSRRRDDEPTACLDDQYNSSRCPDEATPP